MTGLWQLAAGISLLSFVPVTSPLLPFSPGPQSSTQAALAAPDAEQLINALSSLERLQAAPGWRQPCAGESCMQTHSVPAALHLKWAQGCQEGLCENWGKQFKYTQAAKPGLLCSEGG